MTPSQEVLSEVTIFNKYAKYIPELKRRETWRELCDRNMNMHISKFPFLEKEIREVYEQYVIPKLVLPSMRSLQFGGRPIELSNARIFNCSYLPVDTVEAFSETMFLLLSGTGVGYGVQDSQVEKLPPVVGPTRDKTRRFLIGDSIEGWADAIKVLMKAYFRGKPTPIFDYRDIRPKGARLVTSGGKAPGPEPLRVCINRIQEMLETCVGRSMTPLEAHDIQCHIADAVLSGGIRRAAMIALFSADNEEMLTCKGQLPIDNWELSEQENSSSRSYHGYCIYKGKRKDIVLSEWDYDNLIETKSLPWYFFEQQRGRANNSAVLRRGAVTEAEFRALWKKVEDSHSGEPGIFWTNDENWGTNPCCVTGDTIVSTYSGPKTVKELVDTPFTYVDSSGKYLSRTGFWSNGIKGVYKVTTSHGYEFKATEDHRILQPGEIWTQLKDLKSGSEVVIQNGRRLIEIDLTYRDLGWIVGEVVGDGCHDGGEKYASLVRFWGDSAEEMAKKAYDIISHLEQSYHSPVPSKGPTYTPQRGTWQVSSKKITELASIYLAEDKSLKPTIGTESLSFLSGFIRGMFDSDGSVGGSTTEGGIFLQLSQSNLQTLKLVQKMLIQFGIVSRIRKMTVEEGYRPLPDGKGGQKEYFCQQGYRLDIGRDSIDLFARYIGFYEPRKAETLNRLIGSKSKASYYSKYVTKITNIEYVGEEEVFDCEVQGIHRFDANGIVVHNCEIALRPYQVCNLTETNVSNVTSQEDLNNRVKAAAFLGTLQASYTDFHYLRPVWQETTEKDALTGVGMTGIGSGEVLQYDLTEAAKVVLNENERVAKLIGINSSARNTTVKPSGTTSLVVGSSSGIHAWHNDYYIRRMRVGKNEALYRYMKDNFPALIEDCFFKPGIEAVMSFPQKAPEGAIYRTESFKDLLERVKRFNLEWVRPGHRDGMNSHNVSCTISLKDSEWEECGRWMWENRDHYTGISVLPFDGGTYVQAPFENCTKEVFEELSKHLHAIDLSNVREEEDITDHKMEPACAGGVCEVSMA